MEFNEIQRLVYREYIKNGYRDMWDDDFLENYNIKCIAELGLITTEISEAMELIRKGEYNPQDMAFELSDIIIRTLNFASRIGFNQLELSLITKNNLNIGRGKLHGKVV